MNERPTSAAPPGIGLADIVYVLFRHKWMILAISAAGLVGALSLPHFIKARYQSEAKLLIKYVVESASPPQVGTSQSTVQPVEDSGVLNTELEILTSADLALQVADAVGPQKLLMSPSGRSDRYGAAGVIQNPKNLTAEVVKRSNVIRIAFQHQDPEVAQSVLKELIASYIKKHAEIHRGGGFDEFLTKETDQIRSNLSQTEEELRKAKSKLGITSLPEAKRECADEISTIQEKIFNAQAELAEREAVSAEIANLQHPDLGAQTNTASGTNAVAIPQPKIAEYDRVCRLLESLRRKEEDLLSYLTPSNAVVATVEEQIANNQKLQKQMEVENPGLKALKHSDVPAGNGNGFAGVRTDPVLAMAEAAGLRSKIQVFTNRLAQLQARAAVLEEAESSIAELERRRAREEGYYTNFSASREQSQINEQLGAGKVSNIYEIQAPSTPWKVGSKLRKMMAMVLFGAVALALGLAFGIEYFLDQSVKRPGDVETKLRLPLFMTVPRLQFPDRIRIAGGGSHRPLLVEQGSGEDANGAGEVSSDAVSPADAMQVAPWDPSSGLRPFSEALRDRLITHFEIQNLVHKPKLVAVTGCSEGSGVSTIAAGLAASLSETGEGNVLLVDMNIENGSAHQFHHGALSCSIDDALQTQTRENALVQENLYVVTEGTGAEHLPTVVPKRFRDLVPRLKASDYDYIIFDMPPVSQVSLTPRLARFMDMVLMVVESQKTTASSVIQAEKLLAQPESRLAVVLNKTRSYVPEILQKAL